MNESAAEILRKRQQYCLEQIRPCEASGKSIAEYAANQGIDAKAMYAGEKALVRKGVLRRTRSTHFQRAQVVSPVVGSEWHIQLPNGVSIAFYGAAEEGAVFNFSYREPVL